MRRTVTAYSGTARVRLGIYRFILRTGRVPAAAELAAQLRRPEAEVLAAYRRLAATHAIVLEPNGERILRAAPFWGSPTGFAVEVGRRSYWASCIWDALGVPAMLGRDARIRTACGCCSEAMEVEVRDGKLPAGRAGGRGVIHFAVPARHWYRDIVFT
jgi:hypothetical protein